MYRTATPASEDSQQQLKRIEERLATLEQLRPLRIGDWYLEQPAGSSALVARHAITGVVNILTS